MKKIDMRLRPPYGAISNLWYYGSRMDEFAKKFDRGRIDRSATEKSMELLLADMEANETQGFACVRRTGTTAVNESCAELLEKYGDKFYGGLGLDVCFVEESLADIDKYVINGPFSAVNIEPDCPPDPKYYMYHDNEKIFPIYEKCEAEGIPVAFTWGGPLFGDLASRDPKILATLLTTFPKLKIGLMHGAWPFFNTHILGLAAGFPNLFIIPDHYMCGWPGWRDYVDAANTICPDQICFGSSYPLNSLSGVISFYDNAGFRPEIMHKVYYDNAARFLGLKDINDRDATEMELIASGMRGE